MPFSVGSVRDIPVHALKLCGLTWSGENLWFSEGILNQIIAVDPVTGEVVQRISCPGVRTDLTTLAGRLVQVVGDERTLRVIDPESGDTAAVLANPRPGAVLSGLEATRYGVWFGYEDLQVIDLRSADGLRLIDTIPVRAQPAGVTVSDNYIVYADYRGGTINLVDVHEGREVACYDVAGNPTGVTWDGSRIWYCDHTTLQLRAITVPGISNG
jgi:glutamine cyclotransferase